MEILFRRCEQPHSAFETANSTDGRPCHGTSPHGHSTVWSIEARRRLGGLFEVPQPGDGIRGNARVWLGSICRQLPCRAREQLPPIADGREGPCQPPCLALWRN